MQLVLLQFYFQIGTTLIHVYNVHYIIKTITN